MFQCNKCKKFESEWNISITSYICKDCGYVEKVEPKKRSCIYCGQMYNELTWFSPSGCSNCGKSFVD